MAEEKKKEEVKVDPTPTPAQDLAQTSANATSNLQNTLNAASAPTPATPPQPVASGVQPLQQPNAPPYVDTSKPGALTATPAQATAGNLNLSAGAQNLAGQTGQIQSQEGQQLGAIHDTAAAEKLQQSQDYQNNLQQVSSKLNDDHQRSVQAYNDYAKAAGSLKDPSQQFWADRDAGSRILAGFAAFASGLGGTGAQFTNFINTQIANNFDAHKQNIRDLYDKQVAAGKISDSDESHARFMNEAKLKGYDLASMHIQNELQAVADRSGSQVAKVKAGEAINTLQQQDVARRAQYADLLAKQGATAAATARARQKELQENFLKQVNAHVTTGLPEDQARKEAFTDLQGSGLNRSELASLAEGNNIPYDQASGKYVAPVGKLDNDPNDPVPTVDAATGRRFKPEEREQMRQLVVPLPDGTLRMANSPDDAKRVKEEIAANTAVKNFVDKAREFTEKWKNGTLTGEDRGQWSGYRTAALTAYNRAASGTEKPTAPGETHILAEDAFPGPPSGVYNGLVGGSSSLPSYLRVPGSLGYEGKYKGQLDALEASTAQNSKSIEGRLRPLSGAKKADEKSDDKTPAKKTIRFTPKE